MTCDLAKYKCNFLLKCSTVPSLTSLPRISLKQLFLFPMSNRSLYQLRECYGLLTDRLFHNLRCINTSHILKCFQPLMYIACQKKKTTAPPNCNELKNIKYALKTHEFVKMQEEYEIFTEKDIFKWLLKKQKDPQSHS